MSGGDEDDEMYSDTPSNSPVTDMRLKIAMFDKPGGSSATKPKLTPQLTRNGVGPKPPAKSPLKQQPSEKAAPPVTLPPKTRKPATTPNEKSSPEPVALPPRNRKDEGASAVKGVPPSPIPHSHFHQAERNRKDPTRIVRQSSESPENLNGKDTLYPPDRRQSDCEKSPTLPPGRTKGNNLLKVNGKTYRKLPFLAPKGPAPRKPPKPPVLPKTPGNNIVEIEEIYEEAREYRNKPDNDSHTTGDNDEEDYEDVGAFS